MKHQSVTFLLTLLMSMVGTKSFAHDIAVANADGKYIYYVWTNNNTELAVSYRGNSLSHYSNEYSGNIVIPESVTYNGSTYPVTSIGGGAFYECSSLTSITIPNSVTSIGQAAFEHCHSLISITIPNSVTSIGSGAFEGTAWYDNQPDGLVYAGKVAYSYKGTMPDNTKIVLEEGTLGITGGAFSGCSGLTSITIPNSVTSIGEYAFYECDGLISVHISDLTAWCNISFYDFSSNPLSDAHHLYMNGKEITNLIIPDGITSIGNNTFSGCSGLTSVTIPNSITSIGNNTFSGCSGLTSVTIPNSVTSIGGGAFSSCRGLTSITIPNSVTSIGGGAFSDCSGLTSITIPNSVTTIEGSTFYECSSLTSITIPNSVTAIEEFAFAYCRGLTSITIPNSVKSIGLQAFKSCSGLTSITIPDGVTDIGGDAFTFCSSLTSITIPNSVKSIGKFYYCYNLTSIHISDLAWWCNTNFTNSDILDNAYHLYLGDQEVTNLVIPDGVITINSCSFKNCAYLTSITIPNSVTTINEQAFQGCRNVTSLKLPDNLRLIRPSTFQGCSNLKSVTIPSTVEVIYQNAFAGCNSLESVTSQATTPPFLYDNSFSNYSIPLNVPSGCKSAYEDAQGWRNFTNISDGNMYYQLSITATGQGTATYNDTPVKNTTATFDVKEGNSAAITISPDNGYAVSTATVNGEDATAAIVNGVLTISSMSANTTVAITFARASATTAITMENDMQTYCPLDDVDFSNVEGLKAFTATGYDHGTLTVSRVLNAPAGTGLLLQGTAGVTYQVPYATQTGYYINLLHGLTQDTQVSPTTGNQTNFLLGKKNGVTTFYRVAQTGTVSAGKAYLQLPTSVVGDLTGSRVMRIVADDETTGISEALPLNDNGELKNDNVYDLQGRRVEKPTRGLYIVNGRKVVIK